MKYIIETYEPDENHNRICPNAEIECKEIVSVHPDGNYRKSIGIARGVTKTEAGIEADITFVKGFEVPDNPVFGIGFTSIVCTQNPFGGRNWHHIKLHAISILIS